MSNVSLLCRFSCLWTPVHGKPYPFVTDFIYSTKLGPRPVWWIQERLVTHESPDFQSTFRGPVVTNDFVHESRHRSLTGKKKRTLGLYRKDRRKGLSTTLKGSRL